MTITTYLLKKRSVSFRMTMLGGISLSAFFFLGYFLISTHYLSIERSRGEGYHENDLYFQADSEFLVLKFISTRGYYKRSTFHPLFPVFFNPSARALQHIVPNPYVLASLYCALFGAVCVLGSAYLFYLLSIPWPRNLLYAGLVGLSSSQLVFSTVPDTYIFTTAGLIMLMIAVVRRAPMWCWALVSVYLVGINIINVVFVGIALLYVLLVEKHRWVPRVKDFLSTDRNKLLIRFLGLSGGLFVGFMFLQRLILNFWLLDRSRELIKDTQFLFVPESLVQAFEKFISLAEHMFYFNVIAPVPKLVQHLRNPDIELVSFRDSTWLDYPALAWPSVLIWTGILLVAGWSIYRYRLFLQPVVKIALVCLLASAVMFYVYGDDIMLYSCEWTFFLLLAVVIGLEKVISQRKISTASLLFSLFLALVMLSNVYFQMNLFAFREF